MTVSTSFNYVVSGLFALHIHGRTTATHVLLMQQSRAVRASQSSRARYAKMVVCRRGVESPSICNCDIGFAGAASRSLVVPASWPCFRRPSHSMTAPDDGSLVAETTDESRRSAAK